MAGFVPAADRLLAELKSPAKLILNEFVNSVTCHNILWLASGLHSSNSASNIDVAEQVQDWCENPGTHVCPHDKPQCPDWQQKSTAGGDPDLTHGKGVKINRKTWAWNAAAGSFAYAFGTLAEHGCKAQPSP